MLKKTLLILSTIFAVYLTTFASSRVITDPSIKANCDKLILNRNKKKKIKYKIIKLIRKNTMLLKKTPHNKFTIKAKLTDFKQKLNYKLYKTKVIITKMEENIIKSGCPLSNLEKGLTD